MQEIITANTSRKVSRDTLTRTDGFGQPHRRNGLMQLQRRSFGMPVALPRVATAAPTIHPGGAVGLQHDTGTHSVACNTPYLDVLPAQHRNRQSPAVNLLIAYALHDEPSRARPGVNSY